MLAQDLQSNGLEKARLPMYIYQADHYCDDCGQEIQDGLAGDPDCPEDPTDETSFDSDQYPKGPFDPEPTDSPDHCARGAKCRNAIRLDDGTKVGELLTEELTEDGIAYVMDRLRGNFTAKPSNMREEAIRVIELANEERSLVVLYWMDHIQNLHYPQDLYTVKLDTSDDDPFRINMYVQGPYADEWADSVGAVGGSSWESCDGPTFVHDSDMWYPGIIEEWLAEGWDLDLSDYSEPDAEQIAVGRHMSDCDACQDHWDFERAQAHYGAVEGAQQAFRAKAHAWFSRPDVYARAYNLTLF